MLLLSLALKRIESCFDKLSKICEAVVVSCKVKLTAIICYLGTVLAALSDLPEDDPFIEDEFVMIKTTVMEMSKGSFRDLFTMTEDRHFHRVVLAYVNQMFQQISGINLITY